MPFPKPATGKGKGIQDSLISATVHRGRQEWGRGDPTFLENPASALQMYLGF